MLGRVEHRKRFSPRVSKVVVWNVLVHCSACVSALWRVLKVVPLSRRFTAGARSVSECSRGLPHRERRPYTRTASGISVGSGF